MHLTNKDRLGNLETDKIISMSHGTDFNYKKYSLENLENWVHDAINCDDASALEIYNLIISCVDETIEYHKKYLDKSIGLLSLLRGNQYFNPNDVTEIPHVTEATEKDWESFWNEENFPQYTEEELDAMCDAASEKEEKDKCREYNLREAEYYNQRALIDAEWNRMKADVQSKSPYNDGWTQEHYKNVSENLSKELEEIRAAGGFEWTPDPVVSRNDSNRLKYEDGWVYESPDGGKTVTKRRPGSLEKEIVKADGYSTSEKKTWTLPVEESNIDGVKDYYITFPDDLLKAADLKEGDTVEWIDRKDGSYELRKSLSCPPCPPCDTLACADHLTDE